MVELIERLGAVAARCGAPGAGPWLEETLASLEPNALRGLQIAIARCGRKVGAAKVDALDGVGLPGAVTTRWVVQDFARAAIVLTALERTSDDAAISMLDALIRRGEQGEQVSLFRMLGVLPQPARYVELGVEGCRTNSELVFEAIACENPYPGLFFPQANFNQLVLKAIFVGLPVSTISDVETRVNPELVRMAEDFAAERRAAGRVVPQDITLLRTLLQSQAEKKNES